MNWTRTCFCATNSMRFALLVCIVQYCVGVAGNSANDDFTCIAGNFTIGQRGNVTCHFGPDIHNIGYHFEIVRYPFDAPGSHSGHDVLRCHRLGSKVKCSVETGYEFDEKLHDNLTVFIPSVTRDVAGRYACQLIPPDNRKKQLCRLLVIGTETTPATLVGSGDSDYGTELVLAVIFGTLLIPCIIFIAIVIIRRLKKTPKYKAVSTKYMRWTKRRRNKKDKYGADEDASREPLIFKIVSVNEMKEEEKGEQVGPPNPIWHPRAPHRDKHLAGVAALNRSISHMGSPCEEEKNQRSSDNASASPKPFVIVPYTEEDDEEKRDGLQALGAKASSHEERNQPVGIIHASPRLGTFTMPTILPVEKMEDKDRIEQAPPPNTKLPESTPRRPTWML